MTTVTFARDGLLYKIDDETEIGQKVCAGLDAEHETWQHVCRAMHALRAMTSRVLQGAGASQDQIRRLGAEAGRAMRAHDEAVAAADELLGNVLPSFEHS